MSVGLDRMIESAVNKKLYINSKMLRIVYLDSISDFLTLILISTRSTFEVNFYANFSFPGFQNNSWLSSFSGECIRNSTLKTQNLFFFRANSKGKIKTSTAREFLPTGRHFAVKFA